VDNIVMDQPFFSILLPTKNRSEIVGGAIESALRQTFGDFELVVSDNDDSDTATREVIAGYADPRIRYLRTTGRLPMHENWENALRAARGRFVLILEDKMRLVDNALETLHRLAQEHGEVVLSYDVRFIAEATMPGLSKPPRTGWQDCGEVVDLFRRLDLKFFRVHPKGLDSCVPMTVVRRALGLSPTGLYFSHLTPDYASGYLLLRAVDRFLFVEAALLYVPNNWMASTRYSAGQSSYHKAALIERWLKELPVPIESILALTPVKCRWMWINAVLYDYFTMYVAGRPGLEPDWIRYRSYCLLLVVMGRRMGADMSEDLAAIRVSMTGMGWWDKARVYLGTGRWVFGLGIQYIWNRIR